MPLPRPHHLALVALALTLSSGCGSVDDKSLSGFEAIGKMLTAILGGQQGPRGTGRECDYSYNTKKCEPGLYCDPGKREWVKMKDGRVGIMGRCRVPAESKTETQEEPASTDKTEAAPAEGEASPP